MAMVTYTPQSSLIKRTGHYTAQQLYAAFEPMIPDGERGRVRRALDRIVVLSKTLELDEIAAASIAWIETGEANTGLPWRSRWWRERLSLGNLGVTGDAKQNEASQTWTTPEDAANGLLAHMTAYVYGDDWRSVWDVDALGKPQTWDQRFDLVLTAYNGQRLDTLDALNGRWAVDAQNRYGEKLALRANALVAAMSPPVTVPSSPPEEIPGAEEIPMATYNYDNGVPPAYEDYEVDQSKKYAGYILPADHFIAAVFIHSAYGGIESSTSWFRGGNALTDYMVGNSFDGPALDGELRRFNNPYGGRYAWSSGPVNNPIEDAAKFLEIFGPNKEVINMYATAIERSCAANVATNPVTDKEHAQRCATIAYHANIYGKGVKERTGKDGFTCDTFPLIPAENNRSFLIYHGEANAGKRETCPDPYVRATIDRIIADVRTILAGWQKGAVTIPPQVPSDQMPTYAPIKVIEALQAYKGKNADTVPALVTVGATTFIFVNDRVKTVVDVPRRQTAELDAELIGPVIPKGLEFAVLWLFWNDDGQPWYITPYWTRVPVAATQRIADTA